MNEWVFVLVPLLGAPDRPALPLRGLWLRTPGTAEPPLETFSRSQTAEATAR